MTRYFEYEGKYYAHNNQPDEDGIIEAIELNSLRNWKADGNEYLDVKLEPKRCKRSPIGVRFELAKRKFKRTTA
jgi:hypothetical protein